jgi:hypothetical protein
MSFFDEREALMSEDTMLSALLPSMCRTWVGGWAGGRVSE